MAAAAGGGGPVGPQAAGAAPAPVPGPGAVLIGDRLYSGVLITLENCLLPEHTLRFTPSMSSGLDPDTETELRVTGCELIQAAGILLRLPQVGLGGRWEGAGIQPGPSLYGARCSGSRPGRPAVPGRAGRGTARGSGLAPGLSRPRGTGSGRWQRRPRRLRVRIGDCAKPDFLSSPLEAW